MPRKNAWLTLVSPLDNEPHIYADYLENSDNLTDDLSRSDEAAEAEVRRVLFVAQDPYSQQELPADKIPENVIASRRGHSVYVEALLFKPTATELLAQMNLFD